MITRGAFVFSANVHALLRLIDHERSTRVPIAKSTRFLLPGADLGVRALCLGDPGRERARRLVYSRPRSQPATVEGRFTVQRGHHPLAILVVLSGSQLHDICACLRHGLGVKRAPTESTGEPL